MCNAGCVSLVSFFVAVFSFAVYLYLAPPPVPSVGAAITVPTFALKNAAQPGQLIPTIGLGLGAYGQSPIVGYNGYPECLQQNRGCGRYAEVAVGTWLAVGGRRLDCSNNYVTQDAMGRAIANSGILREDIFVLQKVGPWLSLGYNDTHKQLHQMLSGMKLQYVDLLLVHWPDVQQGALNYISSDSLCNVTDTAYSPKLCRISTWRAMVEIWQSGKAKAIGVSNFNETDIQDLIDADLPLPSYNQVPYNLYRSSSQESLKKWCSERNILLGGYSPLGIPDWYTYPSPPMPSKTLISDPVLLSIAGVHDRKPAQIVLNWHHRVGVPTNPRSQSEVHMRENLRSYNFVLSDDELARLSTRPQIGCSVDPNFYECAPDPEPYSSPPTYTTGESPQ